MDCRSGLFEVVFTWQMFELGETIGNHNGTLCICYFNLRPGVWINRDFGWTLYRAWINQLTLYIYDVLRKICSSDEKASILARQSIYWPLLVLGGRNPLQKEANTQTVFGLCDQWLCQWYETHNKFWSLLLCYKLTNKSI